MLVELPTAQKAVDGSIVKTLEDLLALAKAGEFLSIAAAVVYRDRMTGTFASASECLSSQIGGVAILLHELTQMSVGQEVDCRPIPDPPSAS